ncbi:hypothetical protein LTR35_010277 [Friedmanniomyces endolithicus]|uniref:Zn(2)-C6 fungal-type domain-containing protein n=1 Tax=Friedmanniomyces endolithicus TaxID=329885 RepID=A0AAN6FBS7_9PEZI|nr:hypothetical protein LTR35_010277 [Friedmanniomyces endolithicus]KAK0284024.1 hypothetical protein LTS00_011465 [Friedmanniomyces endolithicus]KAK0310806.1 hypothetical protein LTR82_014692 [Friedmanniomyces endolithicus]
MATTYTQAPDTNKPPATSSLPLLTPTSTNGTMPDPPPAIMPYSCQPCSRKKIRCDKSIPACSSCRRAEAEARCAYLAPPPRRRKRQLSGIGNGDGSGGSDATTREKLERYERILVEQGLLSPQEVGEMTTTTTAATTMAGSGGGGGAGGQAKGMQTPVSMLEIDPEASRTGKVVAGHGKSRYMNSSLWRSLEDDDMPVMSEGEEEEEEEEDGGEGEEGDLLTGAFMGRQRSLVWYHPTYAQALGLWETHVDKVEPLCKVLHVPTTRQMVEVVAQQAGLASKAEECLLFAIYHFAVYAMTETECLEQLGQSKATALQGYHFATKQALVNASFLKNTELPILQALVLLLISCRQSYDPHVFWILTGITVRIAQRMGLHRDGEALGLPPFDVQMKRRVFYQVVALDSMASRMTGTGIGIRPDSWDTKPPWNVDDAQIWPGMTEVPEEPKAATEMIYVLSRACVGKFFQKSGRGTPAQQLQGREEVDAGIREAEDEVENEFIRYCDVMDPLHFLTMVAARSAITNMRMRTTLPKYKWKTATDMERRDFFFLAQKILDTDISACQHSSLKKFQWHVSVFFVWGSWDSMIFTLTSLRKPEIFSEAETDAAWSRVEQIYANHSKELLVSMQALQVAIGRITLKAWDVRARGGMAEPLFITSLRASPKVNPMARTMSYDSGAMALGSTVDSMSPMGFANGSGAVSGELGAGMGFEYGNDVNNVEGTDWLFWDQLIQDYQAKGG